MKIIQTFIITNTNNYYYHYYHYISTKLIYSCATSRHIYPSTSSYTLPCNTSYLRKHGRLNYMNLKN